MKVCVSEKPENKKGTGLEVPCLMTVKVTGHIFSKVEPSSKDFYLIHMLRENLLILFLTVTKKSDICKAGPDKNAVAPLSGHNVRN